MNAKRGNFGTMEGSGSKTGSRTGTRTKTKTKGTSRKRDNQDNKADRHKRGLGSLRGRDKINNKMNGAELSSSNNFKNIFHLGKKSSSTRQASHAVNEEGEGNVEDAVAKRLAFLLDAPKIE